MLRLIRCGSRRPPEASPPAPGGLRSEPSTASAAGRPAAFARLRPALRRCAALLLLAMAAFLVQPGEASAQTEARPNWPLTPSGLSVGDQFRLIFRTSNLSNATSSDISHYNGIVQNLTAAGHMAIRPYSALFRVVGSTAAVDARDNTGTTGTGVPIYWLNGDKVADDYADFYDGSWSNEANPKTESGNNPSRAISIFTGSKHDGTEAFFQGSSRALGKSTVRAGFLDDNTSGPLSGNNAAANSDRAFYGLSPVFTVKARPSITDVSVTSRPADGTDTFKRGERIEVTFTFDEPVTVDTGGANSNVRIRLGLRNGGVQTTADAPFLRQDHPSKLVFALTVVASHRSTDTFCVGGFCGSDSILLNTATASPSIVATSDGANANRNYDNEITTWKIDGSTTGLTGGVCDRHPAVRDAIVAAFIDISTCDEVTASRLSALSLALDVSQKSIASLRKEDFAGLGNLTTLNLSGNDLDRLADDLFEPLTSLRTLNLSGNDLDRLAGELFEPLAALETLLLEDNSLGSLPADLFRGLDALEELNLSENRLAAFPSAAIGDGGGELRVLILGDNAIGAIGAGALDGLTALRRLQLQGNDLTALPAGVFDRTTQLRELRLANNALASLPDDLLAPLTLLETVWLAGGNPGFDGFAPVVEDIPARRVLRGRRVDLAAATGASPWGDNVTWSWARTDTNGGTVTLQDADTATPYFTSPSPSADTVLTFEATARGRGTTGSGVSEGSATARVTVPGPATIVDVSVTSRPADNSTTFKRGDRIEVTFTFSEPVRKSGSGRVHIYMWGTDAVDLDSFRLTAELDRQDHPERLIFAVTVPANVTDRTGGSFCIGGSQSGLVCVDFADEIETRNNASIVARSDSSGSSATPSWVPTRVMRVT